jgi:mannose-6-phosphate isomerase-like protein (cupin superfamily)
VPYAVVDADEVEPGFMGAFKQIRKELGVRAFGINQVELQPGAEGREHDHADSGQEEVYVVLRGGGTMTVDGEEVDLRPGRFVFVDAGSRRVPLAGPDGLSFVAVGARPQDGWAHDF